MNGIIFHSLLFRLRNYIALCTVFRFLCVKNFVSLFPQNLGTLILTEEMPLRFVHSQMGHRHLVHDGYRFIKDNCKVEKTDWKCVGYKSGRCPARVHTYDGEIVLELGQHNHAPQPEDVDRKVILHDLKQKAAKSTERPMSILSAVTREVAPQVRGILPSVIAMCKTIERARKEANYPHVIPTRLEELVIPPEHQVVGVNEEPFLMHDSGPEPNRILVFSTAQNLRVLARAQHIFADGTFKTTPQPLFEQLYTIHGNLGGRVTPLVFSLLKRKDIETYERMLNIVKGLAAGMNPETITTDFEDASIVAFHDAFPNARQKGCYFHFGQCVWRRIQREPAVLRRYKSDTSFAVNVKHLGALSFVPPDEVVNAYETLCDSAFFQDNQCLDPILDYFERNWVGQLNPRTRVRRAPRHAIERWNNRTAVLNGEYLTTNSVEGWHRQLNGRVGSTLPNIWKYLNSLKDEQTLVAMKIQGFLRGDRHRHCQKYQRVYDRILQASGNWGQVGTIDFLEGIANNLEWNV